MRCDNHCPRCGKPDESVLMLSSNAWHLLWNEPYQKHLYIHIFSRSRGLTLIWTIFLAKIVLKTPTWLAKIVSKTPILIDILIHRYFGISKKLGMIKLIKGIDKDTRLYQTCRGECQAWFEANAPASMEEQTPDNIDSQAIFLQNICLVDGCSSPTSQFSGCGRGWKDTSGKILLMRTRNHRRRESSLHSRLQTLVGKWKVCSITIPAKYSEQIATIW